MLAHSLLVGVMWRPQEIHSRVRAPIDHDWHYLRRFSFVMHGSVPKSAEISMRALELTINVLCDDALVRDVCGHTSIPSQRFRQVH